MKAHLLSIFIVVFYITFCHAQNQNYENINNENNKIVHPASMRRRFAQPTPI